MNCLFRRCSLASRLFEQGKKLADTLHELDEVGVHRILALRGDIIPGVEP